MAKLLGGTTVYGLLSTTGTAYASAFNGGVNNNTNSQANTFILGSNITASQSDYTYVNNLSSQGTVVAANITINTAPSTFTNPVTASGTFLIVNINGTNKALQLWDYSS
jgi:hypothetical protein